MVGTQKEGIESKKNNTDWFRRINIARDPYECDFRNNSNDFDPERKSKKLKIGILTAGKYATQSLHDGRSVYRYDSHFFLTDFVQQQQKQQYFIVRVRNIYSPG